MLSPVALLCHVTQLTDCFSLRMFRAELPLVMGQVQPRGYRLANQRSWSTGLQTRPEPGHRSFDSGLQGKRNTHYFPSLIISASNDLCMISFISKWQISLQLPFTVKEFIQTRPLNSLCMWRWALWSVFMHFIFVYIYISLIIEFCLMFCQTLKTGLWEYCLT